jgi:hypothetical protein
MGCVACRKSSTSSQESDATPTNTENSSLIPRSGSAIATQHLCQTQFPSNASPYAARLHNDRAGLSLSRPLGIASQQPNFRPVDQTQFQSSASPYAARLYNNRAGLAASRLLGLESPDQKQHFFLDAAKGGNVSQVHECILADPDIVNCQPANRWSALHFAAFQGNRRLAELLLEHGASTELRARDGATPLEVAQPSVFQLLLEATLANNDNEATKSPQSCASSDAINKLPLVQFEQGAGDCTQCHICLEDFEDGEQLRVLPCTHCFHACCVDTWIENKSSTCPVCRSSVETA